MWRQKAVLYSVTVSVTVSHQSVCRPGAALQETHEWEDPPGTDIQAYDAEAAAQQLGITLEVDYYELLEVSRDADAATIKRQYYILARKWHPGGLCYAAWGVLCRGQ